MSLLFPFLSLSLLVLSFGIASPLSTESLIATSLIEKQNLDPYHRRLELQSTTNTQLTIGGKNDLESDLPVVGKPVNFLLGKDYPAQTGNVPSQISNVTIIPPPNRAYVLLEEYLIDGLVENVQCIFPQTISEPGPDPSSPIYSGNLEIIYSKKRKRQSYALTSWLKKNVNEKDVEVVFISAEENMEGCRSFDSAPIGLEGRSAYLLRDIIGTPGEDLLFLKVEYVPWEEVGKRISINVELTNHANIASHHHEVIRKRAAKGGDSNYGDLGKRERSDDPEINESRTRTIDLASNRQQLWPPVSNGSIFIAGLTDMLSFPMYKQGQVESGANLTLTCTDFSLKGNITFKVAFNVDIEIDDKLKDKLKGKFGKGKNTSEGQDKDYIKIKEASFEVELTSDLVGIVELEIATNGTTKLEFQTSLLPSLGFANGIPFPPSIVGPFIQIGPSFDYVLGWGVAISGEGNFTTGAQIRVPKGSNMRFDLAETNRSSARDWDKTKVTPLPIVLNSIPKNQIFSTEMFIRSIPTLLVSATIGRAPVEVTAGGKINFVVPELWTKASLVSNVTDSCTPEGPNDFEFFPTAIAIETGMNFSISAELFADMEIGSLGIGPKSSLSKTIINKGIPGPKKCMVFDPVNLGKLMETNDTHVPENVKKLDVQKVEQYYVRNRNKLPPGVTIAMLEKYRGSLPPSLETLVNTPRRNTTINGTASAGGEMASEASVFTSSFPNQKWGIVLALMLGLVGIHA